MTSSCLETRGCATVFATGDSIMLRSRQELLGSQSESLLRLQRSCDAVITNCEMALSEQGVLAPKDVSFASTRQAAELAWTGASLVSLANNHAMDLGAQGLAETLRALHSCGIATSGAGLTLDAARTPAIVTCNETRIALCSFLCIDVASVLDCAATSTSPGVVAVRGHSVCRIGEGREPEEIIAPDVCDIRMMQEAVAEARRSTDVLVVALHAHFGARNSIERRRVIAYAAIDSGADIVLCHGSHVIDPVEQYCGRLICHGLGNFFFQLFQHNRVIDSIGQSWANRRLLYSFTTSSEYWEALALRLRIVRRRLTAVEAFPIELCRSGNPHLAEAGVADSILEELQAASDSLGVRIVRCEGYGELQPA